MNNDLIEIAYQVAKEKFPGTPFTFDGLVDELEKKAGLSKREFNKIVGSFYTEMLQDKRFIFIGNNQWDLKENLKIDDYRRYFHSLYDYSADVEEDGISPIKKMLHKDEEDEEILDYIDEEETKKPKGSKDVPGVEEDYDDSIEMGDDEESEPDGEIDEELPEDEDDGSDSDHHLSKEDDLI